MVEETRYLFASFDLCNSTNIKRQSSFWPSIIFKFYNSIENARIEAPEHYPSNSVAFSVWKAIGDEVLLYTRLRDDSDIEKSLNTILVMKFIVDGAMDMYMSCLQDIQYGTMPSCRGKHAKVTLWTAKTTTRMPTSTFDLQELPKGNIILKIFGTTDFIGPDIDYGFRISKFATQTNIAMSPDIADVATFIKARQHMELFDRYEVKKIVDAELKGISDGARIPVMGLCEK